MRPPFGLRTNTVTPRSISPASRTSTGLSSILKAGPTAWIAPNCPMPDATAGSAGPPRVAPGAISFSSSSHFPLMPYSKIVNPVALPPGCARLATKPAPTGSITVTNMIGMVRVACAMARGCGARTTPSTSGARATNSSACLRMSLAFAQQVSIRQVAAVAPAQLPEGLCQRREPRCFRIVRRHVHEEHRCDECAQLAARARRAATPPPSRRAA